MKVTTLCPKCLDIHTARAWGRGGESYAAPPELCPACVEAQERLDRAAKYAGR